MALKVGELYASFGIDTSGIDSAISGIEQKCSDIASTLAKTGTGLSLALTTPIVAFGKDVFKVGTEFEAQMSRVQGISGATAAELELLTQTAKDLGAASVFSASEAAQGMEYLASAGFDVNEIIAAMPGMLDLAAASGEDLATSAEIAASMLNGFGLEASEAGHVADVLAEVAARTNAGVYDMGEAMKYVAPVANTMGLSMEETAAAIGLMSDAGIKGSQAGTTLRAALSRMAKPTDVMQTKMDELGISFYNSQGQMRSITEIVSMLQTSFVGLTDEQKQNTLVTLFGQEALSGWMVLLEAGPEALAEMTTGLENCDGAAQDMAATMLDNLKGAIEGFNGSLETAKLNLYDSFAPAMQTAVEAATEGVDAFNLLDESSKQVAYKVVALTAAAGPAMVALGGMVGAAGKLIPVLAALASPIGVVAGGLALFAVAAVDANNDIGKAFAKMSKSATKSLKALNSRIPDAMKTVSKRLPALCASLTEGIQEIVPEFVSTAMLAITGFVDTITENAANIADVGESIIVGVVDGISKNLPRLIKSGAEMMVSIGSALIRNIPSLVKSVGSIAAAIWDGIANTDWLSLGKEITAAIGDSLSGLVDLFTGWFEEAKEAVKAVKWGDIWNTIEGAFNVSSNWLKNLILGDAATDSSTWRDVGTKIWDWIQSGITASGDWIKERVLGDSYTPDASWGDVGAKLWESIKGGFSATGDWIKQLVLGESYTADASWADVGAALWAAVQTGFSAAGDWIKGLVLGESYTPDASWVDVGSAIWTKIQEGIKTTGDWIKKLVLGNAFTADSSWTDVGEEIVKKISEGLSSLDLSSDAITQKVGDMSQFVKALAEKILTSKADFTSSISKFVTDLISSIAAFDGWTTLASHFSTIATAIIDGITTAIPQVANAAVNIVGAIGTMLSSESATNLMDGMKTIASSIIDGIVSAIPEVAGAAVSIIGAIADLLSGESGENLLTGMTGIATTIINGIANAIPTLTSLAGSIVGAIGDLLASIDWATAVDCVTDLGEAIMGALVVAIENLGDLGVDIVQAVGSMLNGIDWDSVTISLDGFANMLINGVVKGIQALATAGADIVTAVGSVLGDVDWTQLGSSAESIGSTLIDGIVTGLGALTTGATSIVNAVVDMFSKIDWSELGTATASLATTLLDGIIAGFTDLVPDMSGLLSAIGRGISAAGEGLGEAAGAIVNKLVEFIITPENWMKLLELGATLIEGIATGILELGVGILEGAWGFVSGTLKGLFEALGFEFKEWSAETEAALDESVAVVNADGEEIVTSLQNVITNISTLDWVGGMNADSLETAMNAWNVVVTQGTDELIADLDRYAWLGCAEITNLFQILTDETASAADRAAAMIALNDLGFGDFVSASFASCDNEIIAAARRMSDSGVTTFEQAFSVLGITIPEAVQAGLDAGMPLVEAAAAATASAASTANDKATAEASASATGTAVTTSLADAETAGQTGVETATGGVVDVAALALETLPDVAGITGTDTANAMASGIENGSGTVQSAMDTLGADVVAAAVAKMSYETGYTVGYDYASGMNAGIAAVSSTLTGTAQSVATMTLNSTKVILSPSMGMVTGVQYMQGLIGAFGNMAGTLSSTAQNVAKNAVNAAKNVLSYSAGSSIGRQFDNGIAAGIRAGSSAIASAARRAAQSALSAAKSTLGIHSPSSVAEKEVGWNYDAGIAQGIAGKIGLIEKSASRVMDAMHDYFLIGDPSRGTVYTSGDAIRQTARQTAEANSNRQSTLERAEAIGRSIADRLIESGVLDSDVFIDGDKVGEKVSSPVSKSIAKKTRQTVKGRTAQGVFA